MSEIRPALSPEEWASELPDRYWTGGGSGLENRHALAALCLHEQEFGFSQWMVRWLNGERRESQLPKRIWDFYKKNGCPAVYDLIAAHIQALLPPEVDE